jgi:hypothetical protein
MAVAVAVAMAMAMASCRRLWPPRITRFLDHIRGATVGGTPLDE